MKMSNEGRTLTKKDLRKVGWRWMIGISTFNYETQLAPSVAFALAPALRKIYKNDDDYVKSLNNHYKYFNTMPWIANLIFGATLAIEDSEGIDSLDTVQDFKIGLMGPFAGIGDTIFWVLIPTIFGSIAAYMGIEGNPVGLIAWCLLTLAFFFIRPRLVEVGYNQGLKIVNQFGNQLNAFTEAASVLGLAVVGALIPSVINISTPFKFNMGDVSMEIQPLLDQVLPSLIAVLLVFISYKLLNRNVKITYLILLIIVFSMLAAAFGILA